MKESDISPSISGFDPPLKPGDRYRSTLAAPQYGFWVVRSIEKRGITANHFHPDGTFEGHVNFFWNEQRGLNDGGYTRL